MKFDGGVGELSPVMGRMLEEKTPIGILGLTFFLMALFALCLATVMEVWCRSPEIDSDITEEEAKGSTPNAKVQSDIATKNPLFTDQDTI